MYKSTIKDNYPQFSLIFDNFRRTKKRNCLQLLIIVDLKKYIFRNFLEHFGTFWTNIKN